MLMKGQGQEGNKNGPLLESLRNLFERLQREWVVLFQVRFCENQLCTLIDSKRISFHVVKIATKTLRAQVVAIKPLSTQYRQSSESVA